MPIKVSIVAPNLAAAEQLRSDVESLPRAVELHARIGDVAVACRLLDEEIPDVLVAEVDALDAAQLAQLEAALNARPQSTLILITPDRSPELLLGAMRAGVREVVPAPLRNGEFKTALSRQFDRMRVSHRPERGEADVIAFMPTKGGAGSTFLATSLAHALSRKNKRVAIIDLNLHLGDASIFLSDQPVTATIADLASQEHRLDGALLESVMLSVGKSLWLLASPDSPDAAVGIRAETVSRVIAIARQRFDFVVLDLGRIPDGVTLRALDAARKVYLVAQTTLPFLHDGKRLLTLLHDLGYPGQKLELVINRVERGGDITSADVRKALNFSEVREIPNSYPAVAYAINHGLPLLRYAPRDPVAKALLEWAEELSPESDRVTTRSGWLRGFGIGR